MQTGELLTRWTACAALVLYVTALVLRANRPGWSRVFWTAGCLVFVLHVFCAFQFVHHWSHGAAYEATARQTAEVTGVNTGAGLFLNYVFTAVWIGDACWWWLSRRRHESRSRMIDWMVQGFMGFMWFNATVVFGHGAARWLGVGAWVLLTVFWLRRPGAIKT